MPPSKAPPKKPSRPPRRRETIEVDVAWLEQEAKDEAKKKKPPRLPGAARTIPPMPVGRSSVPPRRKPIPREEPED